MEIPETSGFLGFSGQVEEMHLRPGPALVGSHGVKPRFFGFLAVSFGGFRGQKGDGFAVGDQAYFWTPPGASIRGSASPWPGRKINS